MLRVLRTGRHVGTVRIPADLPISFDTPPRARCRAVKMMSWPYNSDGFDAGNGGLAEDLFIKANDDSIKISGGSDSTVQVL